jgi:energy-coupling factor transporter ATP-binding protein EcfA2
MDSTAKILEQMDGTQFEKICGPILRRMIPELKNLIPSGINVDGRVIKSLADGFCFIDQTHFATVHITTNASNLKKKWLYNGEAKSTPKGDLIKSITQAREMHNEKSDYRFTLFLVHSRPVDESLHRKVNEAISDEFISVRIIEQRDLALFLDYEPEGQYLRKHLLGIDAIRISELLLKDIANTNLSRYAKEIYFEHSFLVGISTQKKVEDNLKSSTKTINLLTGDSGFGKSTLCYAMMHSFLDSEKVALRVKQSVVENAVSLKEAINAQLKNDHPGLFVQDKDIDDLFQNALVVIDDINKSDKPSILLDKIISWNEKKQDGAISVLCPVWPQNLKNLDNTLKKKDKFLVISLDRLSFYDCKAIIEQRMNNCSVTLTDQQIHALILDTGFDPLLINFSLELLKNDLQYNESVPGIAIENYISDQIKQIESSYQTFQIKRSLSLFGKEILKNRSFDPTFSEIEKWLGRDLEELRLISLVGKQRKLFFFDDEGKIYFRHDRVRDHLLTLSAIGLFINLDENKDIFADPYYSEIIGAALAASEMSNVVAESIVKLSPLAVFFSLKFLQEDSSEQKRRTAMGAIQMWRNSVAIEMIPKAVLENIAYALVGFDVKEIETITNGFPKSAELDLAKFRNGLWLSAVLFFSSVDYFYPEAPTYWWNSILSHVKAKYHGTIVKELGSGLSSRFTPEGIAHAYIFIGFLKENTFVDPLVYSWKKFKAPRNYPAYLWAIFNCCTSKDRDVIIGALSYWSALTIKEKSTRMLYASLATSTVAGQIRSMEWEFSNEIFSLLVDAGYDKNLQEILALLLARIDHPRALEIILNEEMQKEVKEYRRDDVAEQWEPENTDWKLSKGTLDYLLEEFSNSKNDERRRYLAWRYWAANIDEQIGVTTTRNIIERGDSLFEDVLIWRIKHHDTTALSMIEELIIDKPWLIKLLARVWNEKSKAFFFKWLYKQLENNDRENVAFGLELLQRLDNDDACKMLIDQWDKLKFAKNAIETALFLSSPETRELADKEIKRLGFVEGVSMPEYYSGNVRGTYFSTVDGLSEEKKKDLLFLAKQLSRFHMHYGLKYVGEEERLTRAKIESLLPYLTLFDDHNIYHFATKCLQIGASDLCYEKFYPLLNGHLQSRISFTPEELRKDIIYKYRELVRDKKVHMGLWLDDPEKVGITPNMLNEALISFSKEYHDTDAFFIITIILERLGTRKDIDIMNNFFLDFEKQPREVNYWKENAIFSIERRSLN